MKHEFVLILEDDGDRVDRFQRVLASLRPSLETQVWESAHEMIREVPRFLDQAVFISLDHDLYIECTKDPGDGLDVARFLAERSPACPVIIHSSNSPRAQMMMGVLELEGWEVARSVPLGENWIEEDWCQVVQQVLKLN
ncbi:MAG: hypothetical protein FJ267_06735 [Planctomycetes bacterium]|nr:hypothetical protein [Planctomycetota bacterium]